TRLAGDQRRHINKGQNVSITRTAVCTALLLVPCQAAARERADVLIRHATLVDVQHSSVIADQAIAIEGDTIRALGPDRSLSLKYAAARTVDATGKFVMP